MTETCQHVPPACAEYADRLVDLSDGELPATERATVSAHVAECRGCRTELARLDASLARLVGELPAAARGSRRAVELSGRAGSAGASPSQGTSPSQRGQWPAYAAIGLVCLVAISPAIWPGKPPAVREVMTQSPAAVPASASVISQSDALRRIALLEQQARLQTSLELMPKAAWYDEQRAGNQRLLDRFKAATAAPDDSTDNDPALGETL